MLPFHFTDANTEAQKEHGAVPDRVSLKFGLVILAVKTQKWRSGRYFGYVLGQPPLVPRERLKL